MGKWNKNVIQAYRPQDNKIKMPKPYIVVLRQLGGIGDMLMMSSVFRGLKEKFPDRDLHLLTSQQYGNGVLFDIAARNKWIDKAIEFPLLEYTSVQTTYFQQVCHMFPGVLEEEGKEPIPYYGPHVIPNDWLEHPYVKGATGWVDLNNACLAYEHSGLPPKHRTHIWAEAAQVKPSSYFPVYHITKEERAWAESEFERRGWNDGKKNVGVGLQAVDPARTVPEKVNIAILNMLTSFGFRPITIDPMVAAIGCDSLVGLPFHQIMAMMERLDLYVGGDSGLLHMAGTVGTPVLGLFGSIPAEVRMTYYKGLAIQSNVPCGKCWYKQPCRLEEDPAKKFICMSTINPTQVVETAKQILGTYHNSL